MRRQFHVSLIRMNSRNQVMLMIIVVWHALIAEPARGQTNNVDWWSFKPATNPAVPRLESRWPRNDLDRFILVKLTEQKLAPSPDADRRTLIRRVTFDLVGLPPTPEDVAAFLADAGTNAYEKVVDRLLASPRHGERWARHWLDTVHYGESHGYDKDKPRLNAWPYRDYVIRAFNDDKPYARFVEEQLAADALFPDAPKSIPALGFIAAGPWDFVGHVELPITKTDGLIARYNDRDDMVMNTMSTFQSLTVHCARCHDHKFDPITQRDYYGLQAVFAGVDRADRPFDTEAGIARQRRELSAEIARLKQERLKIDGQVTQLGGTELQALDDRIAELKKPMKPNPAAFGYHSQIMPTADTEKWVQMDLGESQVIDRIVFVGCHDDFNNIGAGFGFPKRYKIEVSNDAQFQNGVTLVEEQTGKNVPNPGVEPQSIVVCSCLSDDGMPVKARYVRFTATKLAPRKDDYIFALGELMVFNPAGENLARRAQVSALDSIEAPPRWRKQNLNDGYYLNAKTNDVGAGALAELESKRKALFERLVPASTRDALAANERATKAALDLVSRLPKPQMVYAAGHEFAASGSFLPAKTPRPVHLLKRGEVKRAGDEMRPAGVTAVPGVSAEFQIPNLQDEGLRRAALAKWITDTNNMLTRRSIVNRVWHYHFGRGLVETPNDFGRMGGLPSHPELLDWLAFWFVENGESMKKLHRLIVTSAAYRQNSFERQGASGEGQASSAFDSRPSTLDAQNRLLWRMNRVRLDAEQFHDAALAISGQLDLAMGGPSIQQFAFKDDHSPVYDYARYDFDSPGANRRSIYRLIVRSVPDPFMEALDCPDANTITPVRNVTMTALQALATLNDSFLLRQCEHLAERLTRERKTTDEQIARAYELALARQPNGQEREKLVAHARKYGLASACRVLFNSNEFMFID